MNKDEDHEDSTYLSLHLSLREEGHAAPAGPRDGE